MESDFNTYIRIGSHASLHRFRVHFKQVHAFLVLSDFAGPGPRRLSELQPVEEIFTMAGKLRNGYIRHSAMHKLEHRFLARANKFRKRMNSAHRRLIKDIRAISGKRVRRFYLALLGKIAERLLVLKEDENLHQCRKDLKILLYNYRLVQNLLICPLNNGYLDELQEKIGKWHDQLLKEKHCSRDHKKMINDVNRVAELKMSIELLTHDFYQRATTASPPAAR